MRKIAIIAMTALFAVSTAALADGPRRGERHVMKQQQGQVAESGSIAVSPVEIDNSDRSHRTVEGDDYPVAQAWAAPLTASNDTCMGSSSAGAQGASFGVSIATTWRDGDCVRRKDARLLHNMKLHGVAAALMCQKENIRRAFEDAGVPCVSPRVTEDRQAAAARTITIEPVAHHEDEASQPVVTIDPGQDDGFAFQGSW